MIDPKTYKPPQSKTVANPKSSPVATMPGPVPSQDRIRERAYELYETRGRTHGQDEQDWLRAEQEIIRRKR
jgi:hypothetical protein